MTKVLAQNSLILMMRANKVTLKATMMTKMDPVVAAQMTRRTWASKGYPLKNLIKEQKWKTDKEIRSKWKDRDKNKKRRTLLSLSQRRNDIKYIFMGKF